jgi:hypothetical protein
MGRQVGKQAAELATVAPGQQGEHEEPPRRPQAAEVPENADLSDNRFHKLSRGRLVWAES